MKKRYVVFIVAVPLCLVLLIIDTIVTRSNKKIVELNVAVTYAGEKFEITNNDTIDFVRADLVVDGSYKLYDFDLKKGETYTVWQVEFIQNNGTHYPQQKKPDNFAIWCELNKYENGYYSNKLD